MCFQSLTTNHCFTRYCRIFYKTMVFRFSTNHIHTEQSLTIYDIANLKVKFLNWIQSIYCSLTKECPHAHLFLAQFLVQGLHHHWPFVVHACYVIHIGLGEKTASPFVCVNTTRATRLPMLIKVWRIYIHTYRESGNFRCWKIFVVAWGYEN